MTARKKHPMETRASTSSSGSRRKAPPPLPASAAELGATVDLGAAAAPASLSALAALDTGDIDHRWDADPADAPVTPPPTTRRPARVKPTAVATRKSAGGGQPPQHSRPRELAPTLLDLDPLQYDVEGAGEPRSSQPTLPDIDPLRYDRNE